MRYLRSTHDSKLLCLSNRVRQHSAGHGAELHPRDGEGDDAGGQFQRTHAGHGWCSVVTVEMSFRHENKRPRAVRGQGRETVRRLPSKGES